MIEARRPPPGGVVAFGAVVRELSGFMRRIRGRGEVCGVTRETFRGDCGVRCLVAAIARFDRMSPRQRECRWMLICRPLPRRGRYGMALHTLKRKPGHSMVRALGFLISWQMAALAVQRESHILPVSVTRLAAHVGMHPYQRKARLLVALRHLLCGLPACRCVACCAPVTELPVMNIEMAVHALRSRLGKLQRRVALQALHLNVPPNERKLRLGMIEVQHGSQRRPPLGGMTLLTGQRKLSMGVRIIRGPRLERANP